MLGTRSFFKDWAEHFMDFKQKYKYYSFFYHQQYFHHREDFMLKATENNKIQKVWFKKNRMNNMKVLAFLFPLLLLICPPILSSPLTSLPPVFSLCASRASSARAGRYGPAAGQPADGREDELRQRRPDARPGTGRRPDWPVAPGRHTGPRGSRLHPPRELQPAQHWEPGYLLKRWVVGYISLHFGCFKIDRNDTRKWYKAICSPLLTLLQSYMKMKLLSLSSWASGLSPQSWQRNSHTARLVWLLRKLSKVFICI